MQSPKTAPNQRRWHNIDAKGQVLGRMASRAATLLRGKHKPTYTAYVDCGDFVTIVNAAQIRLTGNKLDQKTYFSHSGYAGGCKTTPLRRQMERDPRKVVYLAVKRMINANRLRSRQLARLKIFPGAMPKSIARPAKAS
jgi:large subunit ribosomal protein L13